MNCAWIKILGIAVGFLGLVSPANASRLHKEKEYQQVWCDRAGGKTEVTVQASIENAAETGLEPGARVAGRVDCLTEEYAIEFDFASKWAEAIGQSLFYRMMTGKKAGIVLILEERKDITYWVQLNWIIKHYGLEIKTWPTGPGRL